MTDVADQKAALRALMQARRDALADRDQRSVRICALVQSLPVFTAAGQFTATFQCARKWIPGLSSWLLWRQERLWQCRLSGDNESFVIAGSPVCLKRIGCLAGLVLAGHVASCLRTRVNGR